MHRIHSAWQRGIWPLSLLGIAALLHAAPLDAQEPPDTASAADSLTTEATLPQGLQLPVYAVLGVGFGNRSDACVLGGSPRDNKSFTAYLSGGKPLGKGVGVGLDVSFWRRGRPGTPGATDEEGAPVAASLANMLANASVSFSYRVWQVFVRAGGGLAWGSQDLEVELGDGMIGTHTASGWGVGYSVGGGITVPVASVVSLAFFGNWNVGHYDMISPMGLQERGAKHEYVELGVGVALR
ncbi:hypothetical protein ACFL3S_03065 [Gemmatimonadota bacterium]